MKIISYNKEHIIKVMDASLKEGREVDCISELFPDATTKEQGFLCKVYGASLLNRHKWT